jgi:hypothetical protein
LGIAALKDIRDGRQRLLSNTSSILTARGDELVGKLDTFNAGYRGMANRLAHVPRVQAYCRSMRTGDSSLTSEVQKVLDVFPATDRTVLGVNILDPIGRVVMSTERKLVGVDFAPRRFIRDALRGASTISDIYVSTHDAGAVPSIDYVARVLEPQG